MRTILALLVTGAAASGSAAAPALEFHGYFRDPLAFNSRGGGQVCFQLPGSEFKARLGNECDHYWELTLGATVYQDASGLEAKVEFMPAYGLLVTEPTGRAGSGYATGSVYTQQMWASLKVPQLGGAVFWAGQRYYRRKNVESDDWFYWNPYQGKTASGVEEVNVGFGKLAVNVGRTEGVGSFTAPADVVQGTYVHPEARVYSIPVNRDGTLEAGLDLLVAVDQGGALGPDRARVSPWFTVEHEQQKLWGGFNRVTFQWASGAAASMSPAPVSGATSRPRQWRVIEQLMFGPVPQVSGQLFLLYQDQEDLLGGLEARGSGARIYTAELRPAYHFTDWFKVQADVFWQALDVKGASGPAAQLVKVTVAPTLVAGRGFLARPELRLFATWGFWNDAAVALGTALDPGHPAMASGAFGDATHGLVIGVHVEGWW
jgi:maltoporin